MARLQLCLALVTVSTALPPVLCAQTTLAAGTTTVVTDNAYRASGIFGETGYLDGAGTAFPGGVVIASGATLQLGNGQSRVIAVADGVVTNASNYTFSILAPGEVVNDGTLVFNQQPVHFQVYNGFDPSEPGFGGWWGDKDFTLAFSNVISGSGTVWHVGGTTLVQGANTYTGATEISGGRLVLSGAGRLGQGELRLSGGVLDMGGTTSTTVNAITATGGQIVGGVLGLDLATDGTIASQVNGTRLNKSGGGTLTITGTADNVSASATVSSGVLVLAKTSTASVHAIGDTVTIAGGATARLGGTGGDQIYDGATVVAQANGTLDLNGRNETVGYLFGDGLVTTGAAGSVTFGVARGGAFAGVLADGAGTLSLVKSGGETLILSGANSYSGGTTLIGGTLQAGSAGALGASGTVSFEGGALQWSAANTSDYSARFSTAAGQAYRFDTNGQAVTLATALASEGGTLTKLGAGTLTLTGANRFAGVTLAGGSLALGSLGALGDTGVLTFAGGALQWTTANTTDYSARFSTAENQAYRLETNGVDVTLATALAASGASLTKLGAGTLTLSGTNAFTGGATVDAGVLSLGSGAAFSASTLTVNAGGHLRTNGRSTTVGALSGAGAVTSSYGTLTVSGGGTSVFSGTLRDTALVKSGTGTLTLAGDADNVEASATVLGGTLVLAKASSANVHALGTAQAHRIASGGTLRLGGTGGDQIYNGSTVNLEFGGTLDLNTRSETVAGGATLAGTVLVELGSGRAADQAALTVTGATTLGGTLSLNLGAGFATETLYSVFDFSSTIGTWSSVSLTGLVNASLTSANGLWTWVSAGVTYALNQDTGEFFAGDHPFSDPLTISGLRTLTTAGSLGTSGTVTFAGGTLRWTAANTTDYSGRFSSADNQAYKLDTNGQQVTLASALTSTGGTLTKLGAGTLTLTAVNSYSGGTTISEGTLQVADDAALGSGSLVNNATLAVVSPASVVFEKAITGTGAVALDVAGTVALTGANTYSGVTDLRGGTLSLTTADALGNTSRIAFNGGTLQWTAANTTDYSTRMQVFDYVNPMQTEAFRFDTNGQAVTLDAAIYPGLAGSITKLGAGPLTLGGRISFGGAVIVEAGTLRFANTLAGGMGSLEIRAGATVEVPVSDAGYWSSSLSGQGRLVGTENAYYAVGRDGSSNTFSGTIEGLFFHQNGAGTLTLTGTGDNTGLNLRSDLGLVVLDKASSATVHAIGRGLFAVDSTVRLAGTGGDQIYDPVAVHLRSATLDLNGRSETVRSVRGEAGLVTNTAAGTTSVLTLANLWDTDFSEFEGSIRDGAGRVALVKSGPGILRLVGGASHYTGATVVSGGWMILGSGASLTGTSSLALSGDAWLMFDKTTSLTVGGLSGTAGTTIHGGYWTTGYETAVDFGRMTVAADGDGVFDGMIQNVTLTKSGTGTLTLGGAVGNGNLWVNVTGGTVVLAKDGATALAAGVHTLGAGATLRLAGSGGNQIAGEATLALASGATVDLNGRSEHLGWLTGGGVVTNTAAGTFSTLDLGQGDADALTTTSIRDGVGRVALRKSAASTLTMTGANTYTGGTKVAQGTLMVGNGGTAGSIVGDVWVESGATLAFNRADAVAFGGAISGAGSLAKRGAGTLTLSGALTHTGATAVEAGRLFVNGTATDTTFTVASGATLGGSGLLGQVNLLAGATLAPGNSPGLLTIGSGSSLAGTVLMEIGGTERGISYDAINVSGAGLLAVSGALWLNFTAAPVDGADYQLFDADVISGTWQGVFLTGTQVGSLVATDSIWTLNQAGHAFSFNATTGVLSVTSSSAVPEPSSYALAMALVTLGVASRRRWVRR